MVGDCSSRAADEVLKVDAQFFCFYATREWLEVRVPAEHRERLRPYVTRAPSRRERGVRVAGGDEASPAVSPLVRWEPLPPPRFCAQPATLLRTTSRGYYLCVHEFPRALGAR